MNSALIAWIIFGGVLSLTLLGLLIREIPAIRRELHLMSM
jgi:hypothetical protein